MKMGHPLSFDCAPAEKQPTKGGKRENHAENKQDKDENKAPD
jgi:hypothetical protein